MKPNRSNQQGIVALIVTIIVSLLLVVITSSAIALMSGELRQATDFDNSVKAYYAATSGLEDATAEVRRYLELNPGDYAGLNDNTCGPYKNSNPNLSGDSAVQYTCQIVTTDQSQLLGDLEPEESAQFDLTGITGYSRLNLQWNQGLTSDPQSWAGLIPASFPTFGNWQYPAVIEVTVVNYTTVFDPNNTAQLDTRTLVLKPVSSGGTSSVNINGASAPVLVNCNPPSGSGFSCDIDLTGFTPATYNYIVRISTRYNGTHYQLQALPSATNTPINLPQTQLAIDVTGRSGDVSRRVRGQTPISGQGLTRFVILTDDNICKVFSVSNLTNLAIGSETGCN